MSRTIQQTENNDGSTMIAEVGTSTGFNAGDLVYYNNGDYKGAPSLTFPTTANFSLNASLPVLPNTFAKAIADPGVTQGGSNFKTSAVLTNGNIVQVFINYASSEPHFRIIDTSDVVQVAATSISATYLNANYPTIGVLALSGGGFVAYWVNSAGGTANRLNYAIYNNTGSVVTAATQDTTMSGVSSTYCAINGVALANGSFVLALVSSTPAVLFRGYDATGTALYAATTMSPAIVNGYAWVGMSARSDSSFILMYCSSTTNYQYAIYSSVGVNLNTGSISVTAADTWACDVSTMSDGTTFVLVYENQISSLYTPCFRFLPSSNSLGSQFTVPPANINGGQMSSSQVGMSVVGLSNGNFMMTFAESISSYFGIHYAVFDSSGTCVTGTNANGAVPLSLNSIPGYNYSYQQLLDTTAGIMVHWNPTSRAAKSLTSYYARISKTTYLPTASNTATINAGSGSAAASGIGYASTTPTAVAVAAASSSAINVPASTGYVVSPTALYTTNVVSAVDSATFPDGKFVIVYKDAVTYAVYAAIFTVAGVLIQTVYVGGGNASTSYGYGVAVCTLPSGKFVVTYVNTSGIGTNQIYSTSYALESTSTFSTNYSNEYNVSNAGLSTERFVIAYSYGGNTIYSVYDATNTLVVTANIVGSAYATPTVVATNYGGFFISFFNNSIPAYQIYNYRQSAASTYTSITSVNSSSSAALYNNKGAFANGVFYFNASPSAATNAVAGYYTDTLAIGTAGATFAGGNVQAYANVAVGVTGLGNPVMFYPNGTTNTNPLIGWNCKGVNNWATAQITVPSSPFFAGTGMTFRGNTGYGSLPRLTSGVGNSVVAAWCNTSGYLYYAIINMHPANMTLTTVAGTTSSTPIPASPVATTSTSSVIAGTFVGVAASTAAAGGTGQIIKNGPAKLNASYTNTGSGAFDHSGTPTGGVKGTYTGSIVNMQGNT